VTRARRDAARAAAAPLASVKRFMTDNSTVIMMIVMLILGARLVAGGVAGLLN